ncbi:hypothetical protein LMG28727_06905 [Paraburkholderia kirstenboschensis]|nr:hypothetical protein LMG28727_06905 [Paraburkholderia kirstenboschensis]
MQRSGRTKLALGHHVPHRKAVAFLHCAGDKFEDFLFERIESRERGQTAKRFSQLQESQVDISGTFHGLRTDQAEERSAALR